MTFPSVVVEFSPGTGPFDTPSWVDISDRVLGVEWTVGTSQDLSDYPPGEASVVLRNDDRLFDPEHTAGTYFGDLLPRVPFRIRCTAPDPVLDGGEYVFDNGVLVTDGESTYDCFYGFVEDGWEQNYQPPAVSTCTVKLVDLLAVLEGYTLPSVLEAEILADDPVAFWPLVADSVMIDRSPNRVDGVFTAGTATLGTELELPTGGKVDGLDFDGEHYGLARARSSLVSLTDFTVEVVAEVSDEATGVLVAQNDGTQRGFELAMDNGTRTVQFYWNLASGVAGSGVQTAALRSGAHHVMATRSGSTTLEVDGVTSTGDPLIVVYVSYGDTGTSISGRKGSEIDRVGALGSVALFSPALSAPRRAAHAAAALAPLDGLRTDEQVEWVLEHIGVPASMYDLDVGVSRMGPLNSRGRNALEVLREVTHTEQGALYVDHLDGGRLRFRHRFHSWLDTRAIVTQATFSDDPAADYNRVDPGSLVMDPNGVRSVINRVSVTWSGGEEISEDASSRSAYGPRGVQVDTLAPTAAVARGIGDWIVAHNAQPATRIRGFAVDAGAEPSGFYPALNLHIGDRVSFRHKPQDTGSAVTRDLEVLGASHQVDGVQWITDFYVRDAPNSGLDLFLLGSSELGGTHVLAY